MEAKNEQMTHSRLMKAPPDLLAALHRLVSKNDDATINDTIPTDDQIKKIKKALIAIEIAIK